MGSEAASKGGSSPRLERGAGKASRPNQWTASEDEACTSVVPVEGTCCGAGRKGQDLEWHYRNGEQPRFFLGGKSHFFFWHARITEHPK